MFVFVVVYSVLLMLLFLVDKHRLLSQVVRPLEPLRSPPGTPADDKPSRWKDDERRGDKRDGRGRHEDPDPRGERGRGAAERRAEDPPDAGAGGSDARGRAKDQREPTPPPPPATAAPDDRDVVAASAVTHEEGKKKTKGLKKGVKKGRKEDDGGPPALGATVGDRFNPEPPSMALPDGPPPLQPPRKGPKKKALDKKRKRSRGAESDVSEEEPAAAAITHPPAGKRKRGPRTPPPTLKEPPPAHRAAGATTEPPSLPPLKMDANFSDWSDEDVLERGGEPAAPPAPVERPPVEPLPRRTGPRGGGGRVNSLPIAPLLPQEPPMLLPTLPPQPLMSQPLLRKPPPEQKRSSSIGSNQSRASVRRLRSPSNESAHREEPQQGPRSRRGRMQGGNSRDRERERERDRERERERERPPVTEPPAGERKSRMDQLRRGEPSRSTSSGTEHLCLSLSLYTLTSLVSTLAANPV